ncbi:hypothetical protein JKF63_02436 [Porcisia hertigi]|uniref:Uncharacterized protein n=1 Tax=Porcisia hertigi TaxID=2761500 RepID=A0A836IIM1_9TRYP|nr:hypothetical protein JKF63_02436 [Porcisia hertigi]
MPGPSSRGATYVSCHIQRLPACFARAAVAICKLTAPAPEIPPLLSLCTSGLPGYSASEGEAFSAAAGGLHPRHQLPFVLSRVAASKAIASLSRGESSAVQAKRGASAVVFTDHREMAPKLHGCRLSITHEDSVAASVAWPVSLSDPSYFSVRNSLPGVLGHGTKPGASHSTLAAATAGEFAYAIDVASVADIHRVRSRFPQFGQRWMPQCATAASAEDVRRGLACLQKKQSEDMDEGGEPDERECSVRANSRKGASLRGEWWEHLPTPCVSEADAYASVVLAQHWGARECAVKLVGIAGRAFAYECVRAPPPRNDGVMAVGSAPFTVSFMAPKTLYCAEVSGVEASALALQGLQPLVCFYMWTEWVSHSSTVDLPYVVMLACAPYGESTR